jgi:NAD(P)-dependent dehydrogenase (short-subunit alcohol dehydrogenase family)
MLQRATPFGDYSYNGLQVLIVTGCSSGIGLAAATMALDGGAKIFGVDISASPTSLDGRADWTFIQINLTETSAATTVAEKCIAQYGRIDSLLNVAGVMDNMASADAVIDDIWDRCIAVNLTAPVKLMRAVLPCMREQKSGSIVNVASKAAMSGAAAGIAYTASELHHHTAHGITD